MKILVYDRKAGARLRIIFIMLACVLVGMMAVFIANLCQTIYISTLPKEWKPGQNRVYNDMLAALRAADEDYARSLPRGIVIDQRPPSPISAMYRLRDGSYVGQQYPERPRRATAADYERPYVLYNPQFRGDVLLATTPLALEAPSGTKGAWRERAVDLEFHAGRFHVRDWYLLRDNGKLIPEDKRVFHHMR